MNILAKIVVGSNLYGTNTASSDMDYKGIFLPDLKDLILGNFLGNCPKSINLGTPKESDQKNKAGDIDYELYSLQYFLKLAQEGQTIAIEMLFAPTEMWVNDSPQWRWLNTNRHKFLCKSMKSFFGYCRTQATKYSNKGNRLLAIQKTIEMLSYIGVDSLSPLSQCWDQLPEGEFITKYVEPRNNANMFSVCGRKFHDTACVSYVLEQLYKVRESYGQRAFSAESNQGIDWKAVSHAFRIGLELKEILETSDLQFPLRDAEFLRDIKLGKMNFKEDHLEDKLEDLLQELETLEEKSTLPKNVDIVFAKDWLTRIYLGANP